MIQDLFFELVQITLGNRDGFSEVPTSEEWTQLFQTACKHSLESVLLDGVNRAKQLNTNLNLNQGLVLGWIGVGLQTEARNKIQNERSKGLYQIFKLAGYRSCILKGQGTALYYEHPEHRQCGDIDIWVEGERDEILSFIKKQGLVTDGIDYQHTNVKFFNDVEVEVHFVPSFMYSPSTNIRLQKFFRKKADIQFYNYDDKVDFPHTTLDFDLVFSMVHIYRHIFSEGIGLRQLMDYYYILQYSTEVQRKEAFDVLRSLRMKSFVGGIMWILKECFCMKEVYELCPVNDKHGKFLLSEIMTAGNFGHYDERVRRVNPQKRLKRGVYQLRRNLHFVRYYPSEVLWAPIWKTWHWCWRKGKGFFDI